MKLNQDGVSAVVVALSLFALIGVSALAIDISHLYLVKNQLQNGADAGALSGVQNLYLDDGTINPDSDALGRDTAVLNNSDKTAVEVNLPGDVQRGHWSFTTHMFKANEDLSPGPVPLDANPDTYENLINAVQCTTRRETTQAASFFARIFGNTGFSMNTTATAIIGTAPPLSFDIPIAICRQAIENPDGTYSCNVGRMINSGNNSNGQSGGWTNFSQSPCATANASDMQNIVDSTKMCGGNGINKSLTIFQGVGTVNGQQDSVYAPLYNCWQNDAAYKTNPSNKYPDKIATWTLPVIDCDQSGRVTGNCSTVVGAVTVRVVWITNQNDPQFKNVPTKMDNWSCPAGCGSGKNLDGQCCWNSFATNFGIGSGTDRTPYYTQKTIYFLPDCTKATDNSGFPALYSKIPRLVK